MCVAYTLATAGAADEPFLRSVYASTRADELALVAWTPGQKQAFVDMQYDAQFRHYSAYYPRATWSVILREGVPIGRLIVQRGENALQLMDIALLPEFRGAGTGTAVLRDLMAQARQAGLPLVLHVENFNPARRLYERLGFRVCAESSIYLEMEWRPEEDENAR